MTRPILAFLLVALAGCGGKTAPQGKTPAPVGGELRPTPVITADSDAVPADPVDPIVGEWRYPDEPEIGFRFEANGRVVIVGRMDDKLRTCGEAGFGEVAAACVNATWTKDADGYTAVGRNIEIDDGGRDDAPVTCKCGEPEPVKVRVTGDTLELLIEDHVLELHRKP